MNIEIVVVIGKQSEPPSDKLGGENCIASCALVCLSLYVTGSEKTAHFAQDFKIELLVLQDRVALKQ